LNASNKDSFVSPAFRQKNLFSPRNKAATSLNSARHFVNLAFYGLVTDQRNSNEKKEDDFFGKRL
jgi:hypothetical protein